MDRDEMMIFLLVLISSVAGMIIIGVPLFEGKAREPVEDSWFSFCALAAVFVLNWVWAVALSRSKKAPRS